EKTRPLAHFNMGSAQRQQIANASQQLDRVDRLEKKVGRPRFNCTSANIRLAGSSDHDEWNGSVAGHFAKSLNKLNPVHSGHGVVADEEVELHQSGVSQGIFG